MILETKISFQKLTIHWLKCINDLLDGKNTELALVVSRTYFSSLKHKPHQFFSLLMDSSKSLLPVAHMNTQNTMTWLSSPHFHALTAKFRKWQ